MKKSTIISANIVKKNNVVLERLRKIKLENLPQETSHELREIMHLLVNKQSGITEQALLGLMRKECLELGTFVQCEPSLSHLAKIIIKEVIDR